MALTATATFRTKPELKSRIDFLAKETHRSTSFYYNLLLEEHIEDLELIYLAQSRAEDVRAGRSSTMSWEEVKRQNGLQD